MGESDELFECLARDITDQGYSVQTNALPVGLSQMLWDQQKDSALTPYRKAGVGRNDGYEVNDTVRRDEISWIKNANPAGIAWNQWMLSMQAFLNMRLFLGLFSFESHFSRYVDGDFYSKHHDAFVGDGNRVLSIVTYLNKGWLDSDAGELVLFTGSDQMTPVLITPEFGTLVVFLSEDFPHEVLMTHSDRVSIAGWFRARGSAENHVDPLH